MNSGGAGSLKKDAVCFVCNPSIIDIYYKEVVVGSPSLAFSYGSTVLVIEKCLTAAA
jgi:hypothetical protein